MPKQYKKVTELFVCSTIAVALFFVLVNAAPWYAAALVSVFLGFEAWTLVNGRPHDTISEIIWQLAERPNIPFLFGCATVGMVGLGWFGPWKYAVLAIAWGYLMGHFFFQKHVSRTGGGE